MKKKHIFRLKDSIPFIFIILLVFWVSYYLLHHKFALLKKCDILDALTVDDRDDIL